MAKFLKKTISIILIFCFLAGTASCGKTTEPNYEVVGQVVDGAGRTLDVRSDAKDATIASVYFVATPFLVALDIADRTVAVNTRNHFWTDANEDLAAAGTVGKGTVDLEKLASYNPTALIHRSNDSETIKAVEKLGVDVICITVENADDVISTLNLLGTYFGVSENATRAIDWFNGKLDYIDEIVSKIPDSKKKTVMVLGGDPGRVAGSDMLQSWMIEKAGGISVVQEGNDHNWIDIGTEKVFTYNPDVIFCTSSAAKSYKLEEILADKVWSAMNAVKTKQMYEIPTTLDSWDMPGLSCVLGIMYMLHEMYPEYLSIADLENQVDDYYRFMFGRCFDEELGLDWDNFK